MAIIADEQKRIFTLQTQNTTYQMKVDPYGYLLHLYYGRKTKGDLSYLLTFADRGFSANPYDAGTDRTYSLDALPQEFPYLGTGDYRTKSLIVRDSRGVYGCDLRYSAYEIRNEKYVLDNLPYVHKSENGAPGDEGMQSLLITLKDDRLGLEAELCYGVLPQLDIITRSVVLKNAGKERIVIEKILSASLDFPEGKYDVLTFYGRHAMERNRQRQAVSHGIYSVGSTRGISSHQYNPFLILAAPETCETAGSCWSMQFVYSGCFEALAEKDQYNQTRVAIGLSDEQFSYPLEPGDQFTAPEVIMSYSSSGFGKLSRNLHRCIRDHVCRGRYAHEVRPVLLNSWEASYFDFSGESLCKLAEAAKDLGMDMLVMDDGWFGSRSDDSRSLGDWNVNEKKLGGSLKELVDKVNALGLKFGIWFEPEMISEDSRLYREHSSWALVVPGRKPVRGRYQLVLDFSRPEVVDYIFSRMCEVLDHANIEYVKWDCNRDIADVYSATAKDQGKVLYDYVLGVYRLLEMLRQRYPKLLMEGCAGGGGRFDAGMLFYTPQIWCSDNSDAIDRLRIQYGTSFGYPVSTMGAHVSVSPNEQNGRVTPLETRAVTAMAGTFGYELDPSRLSAEEKEAIRKQIRRYRRLAPIIQYGDYYRLSDPFCDEVCAWENISSDGTMVVVTAVMQAVHGNMTENYVHLQGLDEEADYKVTDPGDTGLAAESIYNGAALMEGGIPLPVRMGEYHSYQLLFVKC